MTKIALISDIHFGKFARSKEFCPDGTKLQDNTHGAASITEGLIKLLKEEKVDFIFIAGDLTSTGSPLEYVECYKTLLSIAEESSIAKENIIVCLGNHDVDWRISDIAETDEEYKTAEPRDKIIEYYRKIAAYSPELLIRKNSFTEKGPAPFSGIIENGSIDIFVLNSGWYSHRNEEIPHGKITKEQLAWFKEKASEYNNKNWKVLLLHHHPYNYTYPNPFHDISFLEEGSEVMTIAGECGFNLICHGHRHHPKAQLVVRSGWQNAITFICAGSFSVNSSQRNGGDIPNCFHIVELNDDEKKIIKLKNYEYSTSEGWKDLVSNRSETPLDNEMYFYEIINVEDRKKILIDMVENTKSEKGCELPSWSDLPIELKTLTYKELNNLIKSAYKNSHDIYGKYPDNVALIRSDI